MPPFTSSLPNIFFLKRMLSPRTQLRAGTALFVLSLCAVPTSAYAQSPSYRDASANATSDLAAARQSWRNDAEFRGNWGLEAIQADGAYARGFTGLGSKIGVIDQPVWLGHPEFWSAGKATFLTTSGVRAYSDPYIDVEAGDPFLFDGSIYVDGEGDTASHGTHVAGIAAGSRNGTAMQGVAFDAHILAADNGDPGPEDGIVTGNDGNVYRAAWQAMINAKVDVITNSWGIGIDTELPEWRYAQAAAQFREIEAILGTPEGGAYDGAVEAARSGIVLEFSNGNDYGADPDAIAGLATFIPELEKYWVTTVSLVKDSSVPHGVSLSDFSSVCGYAKYYCVAAPGSDINSSVVTADTDGKQPGDLLTDLTADYEEHGGTSMAGPFVSGSLAVLKQRFSYLSHGDLNDILKTTATDLGAQGVDGVYGWGLINLDAAMKGPGQFLGRFEAALPKGVSDIWSNDISDTALLARNAESEATLKAWDQRKASLGLTEIYVETPQVLKELEQHWDDAATKYQQAKQAGADILKEYIAAKEASDASWNDPAVDARLEEAETAYYGSEEAYALRKKIKAKTGESPELIDVAAYEREELPGLVAAYRAQVAKTNDILIEFETQERDREAYLARDKAGSLVKDGAGRLILSGNNTYSGGTTVSAGVLQIGNGETSGSITGDVVDNAVLAFDRSDASLFSGAISGTGALTQNGTGTLTLSGNNIYSGGTTIVAGTLAAAGGTAIPDTGTVAVSDAGRLSLLADETVGGISGGGHIDLGTSRLSVDTDGLSTTYSGIISGAGGLTKLGSQQLNLSGSSTYTGSTWVGAGLLSVNGTLESDVSVGPGGTLGGTGRIASLDVAAGGVLAPGNSVGTLSVAGDASFVPGSVYQVEIAADGRMDGLYVGGVMSLGGVQVELLKENTGRGLTRSEFRELLGSSFTIFQAAGGVSGTFTSFVNTDLTFLGTQLDFSNNGVTLTLGRNAVSFASLATSPNGAAAAAAIDTLTLGAELYEAVIATYDPTAIAPVFDHLSGALHADMATALIESGGTLRSQALERAGASDAAWEWEGGNGVQLASDASGATSAYMRSIHSRATSEGQSGHADADRSVTGFVAGIDGSLDGTWQVGALVGYSDVGLNVDRAEGSGSASNYEFGLYAGQRFDSGLTLKMGGAYLHSEIETTRSISVPGLAPQELSAAYGAQMGQLFGQTGWQFGDEALSIEPFANLAYLTLHTDDFTEAGGSAALRSQGFSNDKVFSMLGVHVLQRLDMSETASVTAHGTLGWRHAYGDDVPKADLAFSAEGTSFAASGTSIAKDSLIIELGASAAITKSLSLDISYHGQLASNASNNEVKAGLSLKF